MFVWVNAYLPGNCVSKLCNVSSLPEPCFMVTGLTSKLDQCLNGSQLLNAVILPSTIERDFRFLIEKKDLGLPTIAE